MNQRHFLVFLAAASLIHSSCFHVAASPTTTTVEPIQPSASATTTTSATATSTTEASTGSGTARPNEQQDGPKRQQAAEDEYLIGVGIADITGPAADINLMGYAKPNQDAGGIHLRQFSRSIIIEDKIGKRILYTSIDNGMISQLLRSRVIKKLEENYGESVFNESNVMMTATHTHSCPGGFFQYMLYNIPSAGFISQTLEALVDGIVRSVDRANANLRPGRIYYNEGDLLDASVNRSPTSYENNPKSERSNYAYNTDKTMHLLKMVDRQGEPIAMLNWFAVHGTSMNNTNHLISSDNKGYAALLFEQEFNPPGTLPGKGKFVAVFAQSNEGDVSPNTMGPRCIDSGLPCESASSTCGNPPRNEKCIAFGPGKDMFESTKIIAYKQYYKARQLFLNQSAMQPISGPIRFVHEFIDMTKQVVPLYKSLVDLALLQKPTPQIPLNGSYSTCNAGLGYSFAAGTTDGPGAFDFQQGDTVSTRYWNMVRNFLRRPSQEQVRCHHPKPILLSTGEMDFPYMWHPRVVPTQIFMLGQVAIVGLPGEFTTMAGRRVRNAVLASLQTAVTEGTTPQGLFIEEDMIDKEDDGDDEEGDDEGEVATVERRAAKAGETQPRRRVKRAMSRATEIKVILSGLSNIYTSYITTVEEYEIQRYEGASTLYGPHTLQAYVNQFQRLAERLITGDPPSGEPIQPPDLTKSLFTLKTGVLFDGSPHGHSFGEVLVQANSSYKCQDTVSVVFVAGNPRNDLRQEDSFLYLDRYTGNGTWLTVATDSSWETKFIWERTNTLFGESRVTLVWEIPRLCEPGVYRMRHYGAHKNLLQTVSQYSGQSAPFKVATSSATPNQLAQLQTLLESAKEWLKQQKLYQQQQSDQKRLETSEQQSQSGDNGGPQQQPSLFYSPLKLLSSWFNWRQNTSGRS